MRTFFVALTLCLLAPSAAAQTLWSRPYIPYQITVESIVPETPEGAAWPSGASFLSGSVSLNENISLSGELPVARYTATSGGASSTLGNPYLGLGLSSTTVPVLVRLGVRVPVADFGPASTVGTTADMGRLAAFRPDEASVSGLLNGRFPVGRNTSLRLRTGLTYASFSPSASANGNDTAWRLQYDTQLWREGERTLTGLTVTGRATLTSPSTTRHHAALSVMGNWDRVQPGIVVGTSLNDLLERSVISPFAGLTLSVTYARP